MRPLPIILVIAAGAEALAKAVDACDDAPCIDEYEPPYRKIENRADGGAVISMTTTMVRTVTIDAQPTEVPQMMQASDASLKKPAPVAKGGALVSNGSPPVVAPPKSGAETRCDRPSALMTGFIGLAMVFM